MRKEQNQKRPYIEGKSPNIQVLVLGAVVVWSFAGTLLGLMASSKIFSILTIAFLASTIFNYLYAKSRKNVTGPLVIFKLDYIGCGLIGYFFYNLFFGLSILNYGNASEPTALNYTWPFFTALFTIVIFRRQKIDLAFVVSTILGLSGVLYLASKGDLLSLSFETSIPGLIFGILTGASYGLFSAFSSKVPRNILPNFLFTSTLSSFVVMLFFAFWYYGKTAFDLSLRDVSLALISGLLLDSLGHVFWTNAQSLTAEKNIDINRVVGLTYYLPIISAILITLILKEQQLCQKYFLISISLITAGALFSHYYRKLSSH